ncbi:PTS sugar transporter subunit IIA [Haloimpatiens sp. FM7330]|uniref:PTS sugar transporter subunit IIA n=1 Tax=Haloimpatiens sp. FM7330 TaxID=3298610 RepID=UPI00363759FB
MKNIIIVSHGTMAKGVFEAASMIYGNLENTNYVCLEKNMGIQSFKEKLNGLIEKIKDSEQIIVLADLKGGSPFTTTTTLLSEKNLLGKSKIISGLNLPMLLSLLFIENEISDKEVEEIIEASKDGIGKFQLEDDENDDL